MPGNNQGLTTRTRKLPAGKGVARAKSTDNYVVFGTAGSAVNYDTSGSWEISGTQLTESENHPFAKRKPGISDIGGPFFTQKSYLIGGMKSQTDEYGRWVVNGPGDDPRLFNTRFYSGPRLAVGPNAQGDWPWPTSARSSNEGISEMGATAIALSKPDNSIASASTALGEVLLGGVPHILGSTLWKDKTSVARKAGDEYLNGVFGWLPLISDVSDFANAVRNFDTVLAQYERDAGRMVRRRHDFPIETDHYETTTADSPAWEPVDSNLKGSGGVLVKRGTITRKRWFSGAFTYHLPDGYDSRSSVARYRLFADRIGLDLSPETLWNLAPWSWAVDWFSNAGDVVSNVSSFEVDGQVLAYGYMMEHTVHTVSYSMGDIGVLNHPDGRLKVGSVTLVTETKVRRRANPYGFGISWDDLSPFQLSILAALGLSRS